MKLTNKQCEIINTLTGMRVTNTTSGSTQIHSQKLDKVAGRLGLKVEKAGWHRTTTGGVLVHFKVGEDLAISVDMKSDSHICIYLGSLVMHMSAGPDSERLKSISNQQYEVIDGKVIHSRKRQSGACPTLGRGDPQEIPSH